jgi:UDP-N-acetylmuramoylalanine--D-glutamate ligase
VTHGTSTIQLTDPLPTVSGVTVFGLGWTGVAAANLAVRIGKKVSATDTRSPAQLTLALAKIEADHGLRLDPSVAIIHGEHRPQGDGAVILTQSVKHHEAAGLRAQVIPEVAFAQGALVGLDVSLLAVGGTDGKTTTVKLVRELCGAQRHTVVGGNSWPPLSQAVLEMADTRAADSVLVAEISAFQLPPWHQFRPHVGALTNIAEDHVDEYFQGSFDAYRAAKRGITDHLGEGAFAVLNFDDCVVRNFAREIAGRGATVIGTSLSARAVADLPCAAWRQNGELRVRWHGEEQGVASWDDVPLVGDHNAENVLTALGTVLCLRLDLDFLRRTLMAFVPPHHRLELVTTVGGVDFFDDSKATNVHAALAGLAAFGARPIVAIVGGVDKGLNLAALAQALSSRARAVIVIGELRERLLDEYRSLLPHAQCADSLKEAVLRAHEAARPGDAVVLSPACSSFDMFRSYTHRGQVFQDAVRSLHP